MAHESSLKEKIKHIVGYSRRKIHTLQVEIAEKKEELRAWQSMIAVMKICDRCDGAGELRYRTGPDETEMQQCEKCKGTGVMA